MKLERFKEKNNKRKFIILFTVCCVFLLAGVFLYTSFAIFTEDKQFNVINGKYQDPGDLYFAVYVDGEITNTIPSKDSGYTLDETQSSCTNGAKITWDDDSWSAFINLSNYSAGNMSRTKCTMYFKVDYPIATDYIISLADSSSELVYDETADNNLRYIGADPNNYVSFNNELWRIIGVMNNIDDGTGKKETRLKIIRDESIGTYSWDYNSDGTYYNDWSTSTLMNLLNNGAYYNRTTESYYNHSTTPVSVDFTSTGLTEEAKSLISNAVWNLGGNSTYDDVTASMFYEKERGTETYQNSRPTEWTGQIGLIYPSDYGYATSGENSADRTICSSYALYNWNDYSNCYNNDWLYKSEVDQWTIMPDSSSESGLFHVRSIGIILTALSYNTNRSVSPALYLSSNVKITGGDGSRDNPFTLSL